MQLKIYHDRCTGCGACEIACGFHRDEAFTSISASVMYYRAEEKKNYFGIILKEEDSLVQGRPEGVSTVKLGEMEDEGTSGAAAKPILLRQACDMCEGIEMGAMCAVFCPTNAIETE